MGMTMRRSSIRKTLDFINCEKAQGSEESASRAEDYKKRIEADLAGICAKAVLNIGILLPTAAQGESRVYYLKMMGDYHRYKAEFAEGAQRETAQMEAAQAYAEGIGEAQILEPTNPHRMGLALNFSVFQHEVLKDSP